jgi:formylmethanofuran dehydrogenase subunit E
MISGLRFPAIILAAIAVTAAQPVAAQQTPDEWITLGRRVHGGFGTFIPVGIRIGQDAVKRLEAGPRDLTVTYYDSDKAPCACVSDGIMIATIASPGQRSLTISPQKAPDGAMAMAVVRHKRTGKAFRYTVAEKWLLQLAQWNKTLDERGRFDEVMKADGLFEVVEEK